MLGTTSGFTMTVASQDNRIEAMASQLQEEDANNNKKTAGRYINISQELVHGRHKPRRPHSSAVYNYNRLQRMYTNNKYY